jgi:hypothetical protein
VRSLAPSLQRVLKCPDGLHAALEDCPAHVRHRDDQVEDGIDRIEKKSFALALP